MKRLWSSLWSRFSFSSKLRVLAFFNAKLTPEMSKSLSKNVAKYCPQKSFVFATCFIAALCLSFSLDSTLQSAAADEPVSAPTSDAADHSCQVVLRELKRSKTNTGEYNTTTDANGQNWFVWAGLLDVATQSLGGGGVVGALFHAGNDIAPHEAYGVPVDGAAPGFQRYLIKLSENTVKADISDADFAKTTIDVAPFLLSADGRRLFDHNRTSDDVTNFTLNADNEWSAENSGTLCQVPNKTQATLAFNKDFTHEQHGALRPGGRLTLDYDLARLPQCQGSTYNGQPAWATEAFVRFYPGNEIVQGGLNYTYGTTVHPVTFSADIPENATSASIWFRTKGRNCDVVYDSNFSRNYDFRFERNAAPAASWAGKWAGILSASCDRASTLAEPVVLDSKNLSASCLAVEADVVIPGVTNREDDHPELVMAQAEVSVDGGTPTYVWLDYRGRKDNAYRYRWKLPRSEMQRFNWGKYSFAFRFSTDGVYWYRIGKNEGPQGGEPRTLVRKVD